MGDQRLPSRSSEKKPVEESLSIAKRKMEKAHPRWKIQHEQMSRQECMRFGLSLEVLMFLEIQHIAGNDGEKDRAPTRNKDQCKCTFTSSVGRSHMRATHYSI